MADKFEYDYAAVGLWLRSDPALYAELKKLADEGEKYAQGIAPVGEKLKRGKNGDIIDRPGQYKESIKGAVRPGKSRLTARVSSDDYKAGWIEKGTKKTPKQAILARTLDHLEGGG